MEHLESLTDDEDNHFTREDIKDALKALKADNKLLSTMASREWIEKQTKVVIPPNKRNGRKQEQHLQLARGIRALKEQWEKMLLVVADQTRRRLSKNGEQHTQREHQRLHSRYWHIKEYSV